MLFVLRSRAQAGAEDMFSCESFSGRMRAKHGAFFAVKVEARFESRHGRGSISHGTRSESW